MAVKSAPHRLHLRKKFYLAIGLIVLAATPLVLYLIYQSIGSVVIGITSISAVWDHSNTSIGFGVKFFVYSKDFLDTQFSNSKVTLTVNSVDLGSQSFEGVATFSQRARCLPYELGFSTNDKAMVKNISEQTSNTVLLTIAGRLTGLLWEKQIVRSQSIDLGEIPPGLERLVQIDYSVACEVVGK